MTSLLMGMFALLAALGPTEESPRSQYEALVKEFDTAYKAVNEAIAKATNDQERMKAAIGRPQPHVLAPRFFTLAEKYPDDPAAIDSLIWVASKCIFGPLSEKALGILARDYSRSERLKDYCGQCSLYGEPFAPYEEMLRAVLNNNPDRDVQAGACVALADYLKMAKEKTESRLVRASLPGELMPLSPESLMNLNRVKERGLDKVAAESAALFERVLNEYPDVILERNYPQKAGELAKGQLFELRHLGIGAKAPEIEGKSIDGKVMKLSDYRGQVVVLDFGSHRSCGVCRQYYPHLRQFAKDFKGKPVSLLGISVEDDVKELRALSEKGETTWPIWWDGENMEGPIASRWMIRAMPTFYVLDPKGVIRNKGFLQPEEIRGTVAMLLKELSLSKALNPSF